MSYLDEAQDLMKEYSKTSLDKRNLVVQFHYD